MKLSGSQITETVASIDSSSMNNIIDDIFEALKSHHGDDGFDREDVEAAVDEYCDHLKEEAGNNCDSYFDLDRMVEEVEDMILRFETDEHYNIQYLTQDLLRVDTGMTEWNKESWTMFIQAQIWYFCTGTTHVLTTKSSGCMTERMKP